MTTLDPGLAEILACPACKSPVRIDGEELFCTNAQCGLIYPIRDDIPVLLVDEARKPSEESPAEVSAAPAEPAASAEESSEESPGEQPSGETEGS